MGQTGPEGSCMHEQVQHGQQCVRRHVWCQEGVPFCPPNLATTELTGCCKLWRLRRVLQLHPQP